MKKVALILLTGFWALTTNAQHQHHQHHADKMNHEQMDHNNHEGMSMAKADPAFQKQLAAAYTETLALNKAFTANNQEGVTKAAAAVEQAISQVDMKLLKGEAHMTWMKNLKVINENLKAMQSAGNIDMQKKHFSEFNKALFASVKAFGIDGKEAYYSFCPMALNNAGGYWINDVNKVQNPYFGGGMAGCGSIKEGIRN